MSNENSKKKTGGMFIACVIALLMGIHFVVKGVHYYQLDVVETSGIFLLICGLTLIVMSIVLVIREIRKNSKKEDNR